MTFLEAKDYTKDRLHFRRENWPEHQWLMYWRGCCWFFQGEEQHVVRNYEYGVADLMATDWTTMPAALTSCPIDPTTGSTGGKPPIVIRPGTPPYPGPGGGTTGPSWPIPGAPPPPPRPIYIPPPPEPEPSDKCAFGSLVLTALPNCDGNIDATLNASAMMAGDYRVDFTCSMGRASAGVFGGPNFTATAVIPMSDLDLGRAVKVYALVTGLGSGNCKGHQTQVPFDLEMRIPDGCPAGECSTRPRFGVEFSGIIRNPAFLSWTGDVNGKYGPLVGGGGSYTGTFKMGKYGGAPMMVTVNISCGGRLYSVTTEMHVPLAGSLFDNATTPGPLGAPMPSEIGDGGLVFSGGTAKVYPLR